MSIPLLIYWIITKMIPTADSIPLKNGILDTLESSDEIDTSDGYLLNEMAVPILRKDASPEIKTNTEQYDFNYNRCIQFNDRILCGYGKNRGFALDDYTIIDIGNGCRARGDRIECGYENPLINKNLRHPVFKRNDHNKQNGENRHHYRGQYHLEKHHDTLPRQAPTRTPAITDLTTPPIILNREKTDKLEKNILKSVFDNLVSKSGEATKGTGKTTLNLIDLTTSTSETVKPVTIAIIPIERKSSRHMRSTLKSSQSTTSTSEATTLTTKTTTALPTSLELNEISDGESNPRIIIRSPAIKQKRRRQIELLSILPELVSKSKPVSRVSPRIVNNGDTKTNAVLRMENGYAEKVKTACVEQQDRVVCYDFKI